MYDNVIKPLLTSQKINSTIARDYASSDIIIKEIVEGILNADLIIADATGKNSNVNYELGVADAYTKRVLIITQSEADVPFDYKHRRYYKYNPNEIGWEDSLKQWLLNAIENFNNNPRVNVWGFSITNRNFIRSSSKSDIILNDVLYRSHLKNRYTSSIYCTSTVNHHGDVVREELIEADLHADTSHILYEIYIDKPGMISIEEVYEITENNEKVPLNWHTYNTSETKLTAFLIFNEIKPKKTRCKYFTKVHAENFFSDLVEHHFERYPFGLNDGTLIKDFKEKIIFPDLEVFKDLRATIFNHPEKEKRGKTFVPIKQDNKLIINLDLSFENPLKSKSSEILTDFRI